MSAQHTPGPWYVVRYGDGDSLVICLDEAGNRRVAFMATPGCRDQQERRKVWKEIKANARLIAAAPEMVEALRAVTDLLVSELGELANEDEISDDTLGPWLGHEYAKQVISARVRIKQARAILAQIDGEG